MNLQTTKDVLEALSYAATLLGIPVAIGVYVRQKRIERQAKEDDVHAAANERYWDYLKFCFENSDLDVFDLPKDDPEVVKCGVPYQKLIVFTMVVSMLENAYLRYVHSASDRMKGEWQGWWGYVGDWLDKNEFRSAWPVISPQFNASFVALVESELAKRNARQVPKEGGSSPKFAALQGVEAGHSAGSHDIH